MNITQIAPATPEHVDVQTKDGRKWRVYKHGTIDKLQRPFTVHDRECMGEPAKDIVVAAFTHTDIRKCRCRKGSCQNAHRIIAEAQADEAQRIADFAAYLADPENSPPAPLTPEAFDIR